MDVEFGLDHADTLDGHESDDFVLKDDSSEDEPGSSAGGVVIRIDGQREVLDGQGSGRHPTPGSRPCRLEHHHRDFAVPHALPVGLEAEVDVGRSQ